MFQCAASPFPIPPSPPAKEVVGLARVDAGVGGSEAFAARLVAEDSGIWAAAHSGEATESFQLALLWVVMTVVLDLEV